jgi:hypothetical protein
MPIDSEVEAGLAAKFSSLLPHLDDRNRRLVLGAEARVLDHCGIKLVAQAAGCSRSQCPRGLPIWSQAQTCWIGSANPAGDANPIPRLTPGCWAPCWRGAADGSAERIGDS